MRYYAYVLKIDPYHDALGKFATANGHTKDESTKLAWQESEDYYDPKAVLGGGYDLDHARFNMRKSLDAKVTPEQVKDIWDYSSEGYHGVNKKLRTGDSLGKAVWDESADRITKSLDAAMQPIGHHLEVHRALLNSDMTRELQKRASEGNLVGSTISDKGFSSTTLNPHEASYFDDSDGFRAKVKMVIDVPSATKAIYVGGIDPSRTRNWDVKHSAADAGFKTDEGSHFPTEAENSKYARVPREQELILDRNTHFRVDKISHEVGGGDDKTPILIIHTTAIQHH